MTPPVLLRSRRVACENSKWTAYFDHIQSDSGAEVHDYLTLSAKGTNADLVSGVTVIPVTQDGKIVLMRNWRHAINRYCWEGVRGFIDEGEEATQAALREVSEEAGLICDPANLHALGFVTPEASTIAGRAAIFVAEHCCPGGERDEEEPGLGESHRFSRNSLKVMLDGCEIEDGTTLVALYRYLTANK